MNSDILRRLRDAQDFGELAQALIAECEPYGQVHSLQLTHNKRAGHVSCLLELDKPAQMPALKRALGATGLDGSIYLEIPVCGDFARAESAAALAAGARPGFLPEERANPLTV